MIHFFYRANHNINTEAKSLGLFITTISFFIFFLSYFYYEILCSLCSGLVQVLLENYPPTPLPLPCYFIYLWPLWPSGAMVMSSRKVTLTLFILSCALVVYYNIVASAPLFMAFQGFCGIKSLYVDW